MQAAFHNYTIFSFRQLLYIVVTEYPAVNMLIALHLASKCTLAVVSWIYVQDHSQVLTIQICAYVLVICRYVAIYSSLAYQIDFSFTLGKLCHPFIKSIGGLAMSHQVVFLANSICTDSTLTFQTLQHIATLVGQWCLAWLGQMLRTALMNQKLIIL